MKLSEIEQYIENISFLKKGSLEVEGICDGSHLRGSFIYFCHSKKFLAPLQNYKGSDLVLFFEKSYFDTLEEEISQEIFQKAQTVAIVDSVALAMSSLSRPFYDKIREGFNDEVDGRKLGTVTIDPTAVIGENVFLGSHVTLSENVIIHSGVVIMSSCEVGAGTEIFPHVTLMPQTKIGRFCRIHSGVVMGSDGFGYNFDQGVHKKVWHFGGVVVGDHVEIGAKTTIDQGTFSPTVIGEGTKIDNQVHVGHNCHIGRGVLLCAQVGLSGSVTLEDYCVFGGHSGVAPDIKVGKGVQVGGMAGVTGNIEAGMKVGGYPARPLGEWLRINASLRKMFLPPSKDKKKNNI